MKKEFRNRLYLSLSLDKFLPGKSMKCDVFIYLPVNGKMIRICRAGQSLSADRLENYSSKNLEQLYIFEPFTNPGTYDLSKVQEFNPKLPLQYENADPSVAKYQLDDEPDGKVRSEIEVLLDGSEQNENDDELTNTDAIKRTAKTGDSNGNEDEHDLGSVSGGEIAESVTANGSAADEQEMLKVSGSVNDELDIANVQGGSVANDTGTIKVNGITEAVENDKVMVGGLKEVIGDQSSKISGTASSQDDRINVKGHVETEGGNIQLNVKPYSRDVSEQRHAIKGVPDSTDESKQKIAGVVNAKDDSLQRVKGNYESVDNSVQRISGSKEKLGDDPNFVKRIRSNSQDGSKKDEGLAISISADEENKRLSQMNDKANELIRIRSDSDADNAGSPPHVLSKKSEKILKEVEELKKKLSIPEEILKMSGEDLDLFSNQEKFAVEEIALLDEEISGRLELNKAMLILVRTNPKDLSSGEYNEFIAETKQNTLRSLAAQAITKEIADVRKEFCNTKPEDIEKRKELYAKIEQSQKTLIEIATDPNVDIKKSMGSLELPNIDWVDKLDSKETTEQHLARIEKKLTSLKEAIVPKRTELLESQNSFANKVKSEDGSLELSRITAKFSLPKAVVNQAAHAVNFAICAGYRALNPLKDLALVTMLELSEDKIPAEKVPDRIRDIRNAILTVTPKQPIWEREMLQVLDATKKVNANNTELRKYFLPESDLLRPSVVELQKDEAIDAFFLRQVAVYLDSETPTTLSELSVNATTSATKEFDAWVNPVPAASPKNSENETTDGESNSVVMPEKSSEQADDNTENRKESA